MATIAHERAVLADSLWTATANPSPPRPALSGAAEADCVVIGGGFTGLSAALHMSEAGQSVVLLEAESVGWGASGRNGGQVNPGLKEGPAAIVARFGADIGGRMARLSGEGGDLVFDLIARHGISCDAARVGWIRAAHTPKALRALESVAAEWRALGARVDPLDAREMERLLGTPGYVGGIIDRRGGNLHPLNYALGLADAAERAGARLHGESRVLNLTSSPDGVTVTTARGQVTARRALICTNAYTGDLAQPLGKTVVPVTSVQVATAPLSANVAASILPEGHAPSDTRRLLLYFRKDAAGRFIIGGRGALGDGGVRARQAALRGDAIRLYPQLGDAAWEHAWGGSVALTRDHLPGLHRLAPNVMAGLGYNGRGVAMATVMGTVLARWAAGVPDGELGFPITPARPIPFHRFRNPGLGATVAAFRMLDRLGI
jgi:glycine/D-amino acid oxidase-like deaminating enzyme